MTSKLPLKFRILFWDIDFPVLDTEKHKKFIIERLLEKGDFESIRWLFEMYDAQTIRNVIISSRNLSSKTVTFWNIYFA